MKRFFAPLLAVLCSGFLFLSCSSSKKEAVALKGFIRSMSADSFAYYVLECDDGTRYRLEYDEKFGLTKEDAGNNTGREVLVVGGLNGESISAQKIIPVK